MARGGQSQHTGAAGAVCSHLRTVLLLVSPADLADAFVAGGQEDNGYQG